MVQRGYDGQMPLLKQKPFSVSEVLISFLFVTMMGLLWQI